MLMAPSASSSSSHPTGTGLSIRLAEPYVLLVGGPEHERARARRRRAARQATTANELASNATGGVTSPSPSRPGSRPGSRTASPARPPPVAGSSRGRTPRNGDPDFVPPNSRGRSGSRTASPSVARGRSASRAGRAMDHNAALGGSSGAAGPEQGAVTTGTGTAQEAIEADEPPPAMLRGLLVLHLAKPTRIREISVRLRGLARTDWPEGIGPRRMDIMEETVLTNITSTFFAANETSMERRAASIGPGTGDYGSDSRYHDGGRGRSSRRATSMHPSRDTSHGRAYPNHSRYDGNAGAPARGDASSSSVAGPPHPGLGNVAEETAAHVPLSTLSRIASSTDLESQYHDVPPILPGEQAPAYEAVPSLPSSPAAAPSRALPQLGNEPLSPDPRRLLNHASRLEHSPTPSRSPLGISSRTPSSSDSDVPPMTTLERTTTSASRHSHESGEVARLRNGPSTDASSPSPATSSYDVSSASEADTVHGRTAWDSAPVLSSTMNNFDRGRSPTRAQRTSQDDDESANALASDITLPGGGQTDSRQSSNGPTFQSRASNRQSPSPAASGVPRPSNRSGSISNSLRRTTSGASTVTTTAPLSSFPAALRNLSASGASRSTSRGGRFSLAGIGEALRGKSASRARESSSVRGDATRAESKSSRREPSPDTRRVPGTRDQSRGRKTALKVLRDALTSASTQHDGDGGADGDNDASDDEVQATGWKEFRAGTYTYPISIAVPASLPPTISASFGHVTYVLKATVHRAGALTPNLTSSTEIVLVSAPSQDDTEENESIVVERFWETQMKYHVALSGKSFAIGSQIPISIRLNPMAKVKVYRITAVLEQKTNYYASGRKLTRHETPKKFALLRIEHKDPKEPLLPILSDDARAISDHPLADFFINPTSSDDSTPALLDPLGPWNIESYLQLPTCSSKIAFSTHHEQANISTSHLVKVMLRVERGDDDYLDSKGKRKLWDVIIESPIHVLACQCAQNSLPAYSPSGGWTNGGYAGGGGGVQPCEIHSPPSMVGGPIASTSRHAESTSSNRSQSHSRVRNAAALAAAAVAAAASPSHHHSDLSGPAPIPASELEQTNALFARLVAGEETPAGEVPPTYDSAIHDLDGGTEERTGRTPVGRGRARTRDHSVEVA